MVARPESPTGHAPATSSISHRPSHVPPYVAAITPGLTHAPELPASPCPAFAVACTPPRRSPRTPQPPLTAPQTIRPSQLHNQPPHSACCAPLRYAASWPPQSYQPTQSCSCTALSPSTPPIAFSLSTATAPRSVLMHPRHAPRPATFARPMPSAPTHPALPSPPPHNRSASPRRPIESAPRVRFAPSARPTRPSPAHVSLTQPCQCLCSASVAPRPRVPSRPSRQSRHFPDIPPPSRTPSRCLPTHLPILRSLVYLHPTSCQAYHSDPSLLRAIQTHPSPFPNCRLEILLIMYAHATATWHYDIIS